MSASLVIEQEIMDFWARTGRKPAKLHLTEKMLALISLEIGFTGDLLTYMGIPVETSDTFALVA